MAHLSDTPNSYIIYESSNTIVVSYTYLFLEILDKWEGDRKGTLESKFFNKLIFVVESGGPSAVDPTTMTPDAQGFYKYSVKGPLFFVDAKNNPSGAGNDVDQTLLQLEKYYIDNGINYSKGDKKGYLLNTYSNEIILTSPLDIKPTWVYYRITKDAFFELNPNFAPSKEVIKQKVNEQKALHNSNTTPAPIDDQAPAEEQSVGAGGIDTTTDFITTTVEKVKEDLYKKLANQFLANNLLNENYSKFYITNEVEKLGDTFTLYGQFNSSDPKRSIGADLSDEITKHIKGVFEYNKISYKLGDADVFSSSGDKFKLEVKLNPTGSQYKFRYSFVVNSSIIIGANPNLVSVSRPAEGSGGSEQSRREPTTLKYVTGQNSSTEELGIKNCIYKFDDLKTFMFVANQLLIQLNEKLKEFNAVLDRPINLTFQASRIMQLQEELLRLINSKLSQQSANSTTFDSLKDYVNIKFDTEYRLISIGIIKAIPEGQNFAGGPQDQTFKIFPPEGQTNSSQPLLPPTYFASQTTNSLIYNLSKIYNKHNKSFELNTSARTPAGSSVFVSEELAKQFLNNYLYPQSSLVLSNVTRDIIQKFILGDVRMLDDDFYRKYKKANEDQFSENLKANLFNEMSTQYENIADIIGEGWFSGKFQEVHSVEQFYEQLGQYMPIDQIIKVSVKCLFYLVPLDEWLDTICEPILKKFDEYNQLIIDELDSMGQTDGIAKDLAKELKNIYQNRILNPALKYGEGIIERSLKDSVKILKEADQRYSWTTTPLLNSFINRIAFGYKSVLSAIDRKKVNYPPAGFEDTFLPNDIATQLKKVKEREGELQGNLAKLDENLKVFNNQNIPEKFVQQRKYYTDQLTEVNKQKQALLNGEQNAKKQEAIYKILFGVDKTTQVLFNLVLIDPYLTEEERAEVIKTQFIDNAIINVNGIYDEPDGGYSSMGDAAVLALKNLKIPNQIKELLPDTFGFTFPADFNYMNSKKAKKDMFDINLAHVKSLVQALDTLQKDQNAAFNILADLEKFGTGLLDETVKTLMGDPTKRRYLCFAILSAIPAAGYLLYQLIENYEQVGNFLEKEMVALTKSIERRLEMFFMVEYPIMDILEQVGEIFKQVLLNFLRDSIINGILWSLKEISKACQDEEKVNAPYNPIGAIDLSSLLKQSKNGGSGRDIGSLDKSPSFGAFLLKDPTFSVQNYEKILDLISSNFSIRETCGLMGGTAFRSLYDKALNIIKDSGIIKDTQFFEYYGTTDGIIEFFDTIGKDFDFSFCAEAINDFNEQKSILLEACFGTDDTLLSPSNFSGVQIEDLLSAKSNLRNNALPSLVDQLQNLFKPFNGPTKCEMLPELTDLEKFAGREIGKAIFGGIETTFETGARSISSILEDMYSPMGKFTNSIMSTYENIPSGKIPTVNDLIENSLASYKEAQAEKEFIAPQLFNEFAAYVESSQNSLFVDKTGVEEISSVNYSFEIENNSSGYFTDSARKIDFNFDVENNEVRFNYLITVGDTAQENAENTDIESPDVEKYIASYKQSDYFDYEKYGLDRPIPEDILFKSENAIFKQPIYENQKLKNALAFYSLENNFYEKILNSVFIDLGKQSFRLGLYKRENFKKLNFNKNITGRTITTPSGERSLCFPGFMNKDILTRQMINLASKINCLYTESATEIPLNLAALKISLDTFLRAIAFQETMKSLFVFGLYPEDLIYLNEENSKEYSIFEQILNLEIQKVIKQTLTLQYKHFGNFYNDVFRKFITDLMRALFEDDTITDDFAYNFITNSQLQFVKLSVRDMFKNAFPLGAVFDQTSQFQLLQSQKNITGEDFQQTPTENEPLNVESKLNFIVNDELNFDYGVSKTLFAGQQLYGLPTKETIEAYAFLENVDIELNIVDSAELLQSQKTPVFRIEPTEEQLSAIQIGNEQLLDELGINATKNRDGITLDKYIELSPNDSFYEQYGEFLEEFFQLLGAGLSTIPDGDPDKIDGLKKYARWLKRFIYETKLFMFFPQLLEIIDSLDNPSWTSAKWYKYKTTLNYSAGEYFDLFKWFFRYNFDSSFFNKQENVEWYQNFIKKDTFAEVNFSLWGKISLSDFKLIIDKMIYPYSDEKNNNNVFSQDDIKIQLSPTNYYINPTSIQDYLNLILYNANNDPNVDKWSNTNFFLKLVSQGNYKLINSQFLQPLQAFLQQNVFIETETLEGKSFFEWLYKKPMHEIMNINFVSRLEANIASKTNDEESVNITFQEIPTYAIIPSAFVFESNLYTNSVQPKSGEDYRYRKILMQEKIGSYYTVEGFYFKEPLFELKQPIKEDLNWFNFLLFVDKESYKKPENYTYTEEFILNTKNVNDVFFSNQQDIISYYYKVKAGNSNSKKANNSIAKESYFSNIWYAIKGKAVSLTDILTAIYLKPYGVTTEGVEYTYIFDNLTEESKKSFLEPNPVSPRGKQSLPAEIEEVLPQYLKDRTYGGALKLYPPIDSESFQLLEEYLGEFGTTVPDSDPRRFNLTPDEYNALVKKKLKTIAGNSSIYGSTVKEDGSFEQGVEPFIEFKTLDSEGKFVNWGFPWLYKNPNYPTDVQFESKAKIQNSSGIIVPFDTEKKYPGSSFQYGYTFEGAKSFISPLAKEFSPSSPNYYDSIADSALTEDEGDGPFYFFGVSYGPVRGGLTTDKDEPNLEIIPVDIPRSFNEKDIFSIMLSYEENEQKKAANIEAFNDLYKLFFFKEQGTILSLIHRILLEIHYPQMQNIMYGTINSSLEAVTTAIAELNGDYQETTDSNGSDPVAKFMEGAVQIGEMLGKLLLNSLANTFDPTWKTPWLTPGPLTPIGVVAKLVEEEPWKDEDPVSGKPDQPELASQVEVLCNEAFTEQSNFFINLLNENKKALKEDK